MLSGKLIHLVESHEEEITASIVRAIHRHPDLPHLVKVPEPELRDRCGEILKNLGHWLAYSHEEELAREYDALGRVRFEEAVPLDEALRGLWLTKNKMFDFLDAQGLGSDSLALYAEEQLLRRIGQFFDLLAVHLVRGYERARRHAAHAAG